MSQVIEISLDESGHILIPALIRSRLGLSPGMTLMVEEGEQEALRLRVQSESVTLVDKDGVLVAQVKALGDLSDITRQEREGRVLTHLKRAEL